MFQKLYEKSWENVKGDREKWRQKRNLECIEGCVLLFASYFVPWATVSFILLVIGMSVVIHGSYCWAKYKGRSGWWALLGLPVPFGFIGLALLEDKEKEK